jgi:hypothetical protein
MPFVPEPQRVNTVRKPHLGTLAFAAAAAAGAVWAGARGGFWGWAIAAALAVTALLALVGARLREAPCPSCGAVVYGISEGSYASCSGCHRYLTGNGAELWLVPEDTIATSPSFGVTLPESLHLPALCAGCGARATRLIEVRHRSGQTGLNVALGVASLAAGGLLVRTGGGSSWTLAVPHCDDHDDGAALDKTVRGLVLKVRSYAFQRAFLALNAGAAKAPARG